MMFKYKHTVTDGALKLGIDPFPKVGETVDKLDGKYEVTHIDHVDGNTAIISVRNVDE